MRRREGGDRRGGGGRGREHVGGRAREMEYGKDSPSLHQVSYCSHRWSSSQVIVVGPFILLQDLFYKRNQEQTTRHENNRMKNPALSRRKVFKNTMDLAF